MFWYTYTKLFWRRLNLTGSNSHHSWSWKCSVKSSSAEFIFRNTWRTAAKMKKCFEKSKAKYIMLFERRGGWYSFLFPIWVTWLKDRRRRRRMGRSLDRLTPAKPLAAGSRLVARTADKACYAASLGIWTIVLEKKRKEVALRWAGPTEFESAGHSKHFPVLSIFWGLDNKREVTRRAGVPLL